jgi:hypothetical protein
MVKNGDQCRKRNDYKKPSLEKVSFAVDEMSFQAVSCKTSNTLFTVLRNFSWFCSNSSCKDRRGS